MLRSEAIAIIRRGLGFRDDLEDDIVAALQEAQRLLEQGRTLPSWLKSEDQSFAVPSGSADVALPTDFLREVDGETFHYTDTATADRVFLEKFIDLNLLKQTLDVSDTDPGKPLAYYLRKATVGIYPERNGAFTLTWSYYAKAQVLSTDIENAWLAKAPEALIGRAGMVICEALGLSDPAMQARHAAFKFRYESGWSAMFSDDVLRDEANYPLYMGAQL